MSEQETPKGRLPCEVERVHDPPDEPLAIPSQRKTESGDEARSWPSDSPAPTPSDGHQSDDSGCEKPSLFKTKAFRTAMTLIKVIAAVVGFVRAILWIVWAYHYYVEPQMVWILPILHSWVT